MTPEKALHLADWHKTKAANCEDKRLRRTHKKLARAYSAEAKYLRDRKDK